MPLNLTGVPPTSIGDTFDLALGWINPATDTALMVGYVITPSGQFSETTNIQDEQHLVQIASPFSSDRYGRFPKVSQGDWSGGERQLIFVTGNQYYSSQNLETSVPGHLYCYGQYFVLAPPKSTAITPTVPSHPIVSLNQQGRVHLPISFVAAAACNNPGAGPEPTATMPSAALPGDTAIAFFYGTPNGVSGWPPAGWTQVGSAAGIIADGVVLSRVVLAGDPGTVFTFPGSQTFPATVDIVVFRNVTGVGPYAGTGSTLTAPSVVAAATGDVLLCLWGTGDNPGTAGTWSIAATSGMTSDLAQGGSPSTFYARTIAHLALTTGGATATQTATGTFSSGSVYSDTSSSVILYGAGGANPLLYLLGYDGTNYWVMGLNSKNSSAFSTPVSLGTNVPSSFTAAGIQTAFLTISGVGVDQITSTPALTLTVAESADTTPTRLGYFAGSIWYVNTATPNVLRQITPAWPASPVTVYTAFALDGTISVLGAGASGLVLCTSSGGVYTFDGATATQVGWINAVPLDMVTAHGVTYILALGAGPNGSQPVIYQLNGSTLATFDDYTLISSEFQAQPSPLATAYGATLDADSEWLYLFFPGLAAKRYSLTTAAITDVGSHVPSNQLGHFGAALGGGGIAEVFTDGNLYTTIPSQGGPNTNGVLITSWFDFGVPDLDKSFDQIEFTFNNPIDNTTINSLQVSFQCNSSAAAWTALSPTLAVNSNDVNFYLPSHTIGSRVRFQITLIAALAPDIQTYSVSATLARAWQVTVSCRRDQSDRQGNPGQDVNQLTSTQKLANIKNAYTVAGGNVVLYMPDPTIDEAAVAAGLGPCLGVSQCYAVLQDYTWTAASGVSPAYRTGMAPQPDGIEGDVALVLTEQLG